MLVPEGSLKWPVLRPNRETFDFGDADTIAAFARSNGLGLRGHTLAWYGGMPAWAEAITSPVEAEWVLTSHIEAVVSRYRGFIGSWDVVNEPMPENPVSPRDLRSFVWTKTLGAEYIPIAFKAAHAADPAAQLVLNEYDIEFVGPRFAMRRAGILAIARSLVDRGIPIHAIGLQAHLFADREIDRDGLQAFLREIKALKLDVLVTELDVIDVGLPTDARHPRCDDRAQGGRFPPRGGRGDAAERGPYLGYYGSLYLGTDVLHPTRRHGEPAAPPGFRPEAQAADDRD